MRNSVIALLIAGTCIALDAQAVDLLQIYQQALVNDAQYASARAALRAGQEALPQARAGLLPSVGLSGGSSRTEIEDMRTVNGSSYSLALTQPLFRWANWQQYEQGKLAVALSEAQFAQTRQDLILRVSQAYFDVLAAQDTIGFVQAQKSAITEQLESAKRNFEVGTATITDTHEAQARFDLAVALEYAAQSDLEIKRAALQQIIGSTPGELARLKTGTVLDAPQPARIDQWVESAEQQNYAVVGSRIGLEIAHRDIAKNRAGHYPSVDLVASRNHTNQNTSNSVAGNTNVIGVQWSIPLFAGFAVDSRVREAIALEDKARNDLETARRGAAQGARQSYLGVTSGLAQVKALEAAEVSSLSALDANKLGYQVGVRINIDVLNAQQQLFSTRKDLARARYDTIVNGLRLKSAAGTLQEQDLQLVNGLLTR
ncbi:TolC family outer membrane protein [Herminiimonas sp. CN]|uniref:TolC family outer membrane protein n=1 Tax=Herminiimonas sp. CN TaxID=1349818 RepID=UPI000473E3CF|nr:TolC family outer membrane protein [Herminiimonas sp. CN]